MKALFGEGLHPNADPITRHLTGLGVGQAGAIAAARLGRPFRHQRQRKPSSPRRLRAAYRDYNTTVGNDPARQPSRRGPRADPHRAGRETCSPKPTPAAGRRPRTLRLHRQQFARGHHRRRRLRPDLHPGQIRVDPVGDRPARRSRARSRNATTKPSPKPLEFLEENAAFSRMGAHGVAQVNTTGLIAAAFDHRDSRAGDPNLHTHLVDQQQSASDRRRRHPALARLRRHPAAPRHGRGIGVLQHPHRGPADRKTSVSASPKSAPQPGKRPVREIVGSPDRTDRQILLAQRRHRRTASGSWPSNSNSPTAANPPSWKCSRCPSRPPWKPAQAKHEPRSLAEQRHVWRAQAIEVSAASAR